jgi:hypothetical protein
MFGLRPSDPIPLERQAGRPTWWLGFVATFAAGFGVWAWLLVWALDVWFAPIDETLYRVKVVEMNLGDRPRRDAILSAEGRAVVSRHFGSFGFRDSAVYSDVTAVENSKFELVIRRSEDETRVVSMELPPGETTCFAVVVATPSAVLATPCLTPVAMRRKVVP